MLRSLHETNGEAIVTDDERKIRALVATWMAATRDGDGQKILDLMTDDALFLVAGQPEPMTKAAFKAASQAEGRPQFEGTSDIREVKVLGDWAYMWSRLTVVATPPGGGARMKRAGFTLSILRKEGGRWRLTRDANMLAPVADD
jgi:uncharacterized protein (TIGR02246 family)